MDERQVNALRDLYFFKMMFAETASESLKWRMATIGEITESDYASLVPLGLAEEGTPMDIEAFKKYIDGTPLGNLLDTLEHTRGKKVLRQFRITDAGIEHLKTAYGLDNVVEAIFGS